MGKWFLTRPPAQDASNFLISFHLLFINNTSICICNHTPIYIYMLCIQKFMKYKNLKLYVQFLCSKSTVNLEIRSQIVLIFWYNIYTKDIIRGFLFVVFVKWWWELSDLLTETQEQQVGFSFPGRSISVVLREVEEQIADSLLPWLISYCIFLHIAYIMFCVNFFFLSFRAY